MYESISRWRQSKNSDQPHTPLAATLHLLLKKLYTLVIVEMIIILRCELRINVRVKIKDNYARSESIDS